MYKRQPTGGAKLARKRANAADALGCGGADGERPAAPRPAPRAAPPAAAARACRAERCGGVVVMAAPTQSPNACFPKPLADATALIGAGLAWRADAGADAPSAGGGRSLSQAELEALTAAHLWRLDPPRRDTSGDASNVADTQSTQQRRLTSAAAAVVCGRSERRDPKSDGRGRSLLAECQRGDHFHAPAPEPDGPRPTPATVLDDEAALWPPVAAAPAGTSARAVAEAFVARLAREADSAASGDGSRAADLRAHHRRLSELLKAPYGEDGDLDPTAVWKWHHDELGFFFNLDRVVDEDDGDAVAKGETYLNGFNYGVMLVGDHAGAKVSDAKPLVKATLVAAGDALVYFEPESPIVSRSGEDCIVAHTEQWYLKYGEQEWRDKVVAHVDGAFEAYNPECLARFKYTLGWMKEWACSRLFGLGTRIPWDDAWLIESLSDSTIYMAYYTVCHVLQGFGATNLDGAVQGAVTPEMMTAAVWDYVYVTGAPHPAAVDGSCAVPDDLLAKMRAEFQYWYPMDLRVSGKDLIGNHLTMCLYNHAAIWPDEAATRWPRSMYTNGFVLLDGEKMSKSTGNFLMLDEACALYSADAVRFALADAGDSLEDANFERKRADGAINMLYVEEEFARKATGRHADPLELRPADAPRDAYMIDTAFANEMASLAAETLACYTAMRWRDGIQAGAFGLQLARDAYRAWCVRSSVPMHAGLLADYVAREGAGIAPVCPHFAHHVWHDVLEKREPLAWPAAAPVDKALNRSYGFLKGTARSLRLDAAKELKALKGKPPAGGYVYVASVYPEWRKAVLKLARDACAAAGGALVEKKALLGALKGAGSPFAKGGALEKQAKFAMQFGSFMHDYAAEVGLDAFDDTLPFDQVAVLKESQDYLSKCIMSGQLLPIEIVDLENTPSPPGPEKKYANATCVDEKADAAVELLRGAARRAAAEAKTAAAGGGRAHTPVSYTHLTLPTKA